MPGPASFAGKYPQYGNSGGYNPFSGSLAAPPAPAAPNSNPLYDFYRTSTNGLDIRPEYGEWLKGQSDPARQQWAKERYGVDLGSMLNQYGGADLGFSQPPPNVGMPTANLASLYASRPMPWKPAYGMAGYGQGLEMNPYNPAMTKPAMVGGGQLASERGGGLNMSNVDAALSRYYGGPVRTARPGSGWGKPSIGYGGGYNPNVRPQMW